MASKEALARGFATLATAYPAQPLTQERMDLFAAVCRDLSDDEWLAAVEDVVGSPREFFPPPGVVLQAAKTKGRRMIATGSRVYADIVEAFELGMPLGPRDVRLQWGEAAEEAFVSAGGHRSFAWCELRNEPFRRKAFLKAFEDAVEAGVETTGQITDGEAKEILGE